MPTVQMTKLIQNIRKSAMLRDGEGLTDTDLLGAFLAHHDEVAFEALVRRHGPMVLGVCRRLLANVQDTEDAFQATFLVLVRKAASVVPRQAVGNWLYGVAYRTAFAARRASLQRGAKEKQVKDMPHPQVESEENWEGLQPLLDQELNSLPDKYRLPLVLCDLEGRTRREVARELKIPDGTLSNRLTTARKLLAKRLARHGVAFSGGAIATIISQNAASACVPASLVGTTVKAATSIAAGKAVGTAIVSAKAAALAEGVLKAMFITKLKTATIVLVAVALVIIGVGTLSIPAPEAKASDGILKGKERPDLSNAQVQPEVKTDHERLQGTWALVEAHHHGKKAAAKDLPTKDVPYRSHNLVIADKKFAMHYKNGDTLTGVSSTRVLKLDTTKKPKEIDIDDLLPSRGIYKLEGDTLTICILEPSVLRPDEFRTQADSDRWLLIYQRTKPAQEPKKDAKPKLDFGVQAKFKAPVPAVATVLSYLNENASRVRTIRFDDTSVDVSMGTESFGMRGRMIAEKPRNYRIKATLLGDDAADIGSNSEEFWLRTTKDREGQYRHSYKDLNEGRVGTKPLPIQPEWFMEVLGLGPFGPADRYRIELDTDGKSLRLIEKATLPHGLEVLKVIVLDRNAVSAPQPQVTAFLLLDNATGKEICSAHVLSTSVDRPTGAIVSHKLEVRMPAQKLKLVLKMDGLSINTSISNTAFIYGQ